MEKMSDSSAMFLDIPSAEEENSQSLRITIKMIVAGR